MRYKYKALKDNKIYSKVIEAEEEKNVIDYLRNKGFFPIWVKKDQQNDIGFFDAFFNKLSFNDVVDFTRQVAIMLNAGLTLVDALSILKKQVTKPAVQKLINDVDAEIKAGSPLSAALRKYPNIFSNLYIALVQSGEASGKLSDILLKLSDNLEKEREFKGKMKGALIYPVIVITAMIGVMFIMITFVIPKLLGLYKDFNIQLPFTTQILIAVSDFSSKFWPVIILSVAGGITLFKRYISTKAGKRSFDSFLLKLPVFGNIIKISALVDATRTLSILIGAGVSILEALTIIEDTTDNIVYQDAFKEIKKKVEKGESLGLSLEQAEIFPPILVQMARVGEQTGHLDDTLMRMSRYFEMESELAVKAMTTLIEPAILVVLGLGVGFLVLSVITPIYNLTSSFQ